MGNYKFSTNINTETITKGTNTKQIDTHHLIHNNNNNNNNNKYLLYI
jgi:hypothetical protein